jgi:ParB family chromosome partitioning protein
MDHQLRFDFYSQTHLKELEASILCNGLLEPLLVYEVAKDRFVILSGHYRIRAVRRLKGKEVSCHVLCCDKKAAASIYCTANSMNRALSAMEEAHIITGLLTGEGYTLEEAGKVFGKSTSWASRRVGLLKLLCRGLQEELQKGDLSPRTAQEITRLPQGNDQERIYALVKKNSLTKDETAKLVDRWSCADEAERRKIEEGILKETYPGILMRISDPGKNLGAGFKACTGILERLDSYLGCLKPPYTFWPWEEYRDFMAAVEKISQSYSGSINYRHKPEVVANVASLP